jgi:medium-chain acyl-[acyl-carrier-protein] hydrolase
MGTTTGTTLWLVTKPQPNARLRLFCFPYAGGAATAYRMWSKFLPSTVDLCPVQLPGRGGQMSKQPFTQMTPLVEAAASELEPYFDRPFAFFGHSMGAVIGFELARHLRRASKPGPLHLFVSGRRPPQSLKKIVPTYNLPEPEFVELLRRLGGTPREVLEHQELMPLLIPLLRADFELIQTYSYTAGSPLNCPITAYGGLQDPEVSQEELKDWGQQTTGQFSMKMLPGDHFFLHSAQNVLLALLARELQQMVSLIN